MSWLSKKYLAWLAIWPAIFLLAMQSPAENASFSHFLAEGENAGNQGNMAGALKCYSQAEHLESSNVADLCILTENYCDLMYLANSVDVKKDLLARAMDCASEAIKDDSQNATAHACMAVCYAKECSFANIKTRVADSRRFKEEADQAIALNPKEDVACYLLGRWNEAVANIGLLSRAYVKVVYGGFPRASNEEAIKDFRRAIALAPGHNIYYAGLADAYKVTGQKALAQAALRKCAALVPLDRDDRDAQQDAVKELNSLSQNE